MAKIESFGDDLKVGHYVIHSKFNRVINFTKVKDENGALLSVVKSEIGAGAHNIVVNEIHDIKQVLIEDDLITFIYKDETKQQFDKKFKIYNSYINFDHNCFNSNYINANLIIFKDELLKFKTLSPLVPIIFDQVDTEGFSAFDLALSNQLQLGVDFILKSQLLNGASILKGVGHGLTPSGDDFISGLLMGASILSNYAEKYPNILETINELYYVAKGGNRISNTSLFASKCGRVSYNMNQFLKALSSNSKTTPDQINKAFKKLSEIGHSSGIDTAAGLFVSLTRNEIWL